LKGDEEKKIWEVRKSGAITTLKTYIGDLGVEKKHESEEEADAWIKVESERLKAEGYVENVAEAAPTATAAAPFAGLFGGFGGAGNEVVKETPKFQGLFKSAGDEADTKEQSGDGGFKNFEMPKFGAGSFGGSSFGGTSSLSFGAAGSTSLTDSKPGGGFTSLFGTAAATESGDQATTKTSFNTAAEDDADLNDFKSKLQESKKTENEEGEAPATTTAVPTKAAVDLPEEIDHKTGEEGENRIFSAQDVKLYHFSDSKWKECGRGSLHVNKHVENGYSRVIMRREKTNKLVLNGRLWPEMMCQLIGEKEVRLSFADDDGTVNMFSLRVLRGTGGAKEMVQVIQANKGSTEKQASE